MSKVVTPPRARGYLGRLASLIALVSTGLSLAPSASAQSSIALNVNWRADLKVNDAQSYQVNIWDGINPSTATNANYLANLTTLKPGMVRVHAYEMYAATGSAKSWINTTTKTWEAAKIVQIFTAIRPKATDFMLNIPNWPSWMDSNADGRLDNGSSTGSPDQRQNYANWCASLVKILNVDNNFQVKYWEPLNEIERQYVSTVAGDGKDPGTMADIYNRCAIAMKAIDPTIIVGGPGVTSYSENQTALGIFLAAVKPNLEFFSFHNYCSGAPGNSTDIYNRARNIGGYNTSFARNLLNGQGISSTLPIYTGESNMVYTFSSDQNIRAMNSMFGATTVALTLKSCGENIDCRALQFWNDADGIYGLIKGTTTSLRGSGHVLSLANQHMIGTSVGVKTVNNGALDLYAVKSSNGAKKTVMIVNTSDVYSDDPATTTTTARVFKAGTPYTAALTFSDGWPSPAATTSNYTIYTISGPAIPPGTTNNTTSDVGILSTSTGTYTAGTTLNIPINGNEIKFVVFSDVANNPNEISRNPEADTYLKDTATTVNYGTEDKLNTYAKSGNNVESFLRFDVSNLGGAVTSAKLRVRPISVYQPVSATHRLEQVTPNTWNETTVTWAVGRPIVTGPYLGTWTTFSYNLPSPNSIYDAIEVDVTSVVQAAANSTDKKVSFRIASSVGQDIRYGSRENALVQNRPELIIVRSSAPVTLGAFADAHVNQSTPTTNYGTSNAIQVKLTGSGADVEGYYQFNLAGISSASTATLYLYAVAIDSANRVNWLGLAPNGTWTETSLDWTTKPGSTADIASWTPVSGQDVVVNVTPQVQAALASGKVSFRVYSKIAGGYNRYGTKEQTTAGNRPELVVQP